MVQGTHDGLGVLPEAVRDVVHRIATDPGRLTESWYWRVLAAGVEEDEHVETVGATCMAIALDTFDRARGTGPRALPEPVIGANFPTRRESLP